MGRSFKFSPDEFYHLYNRGTEKRNIFIRDLDYKRFIALLFLANQKQPTDLKIQGRTLEEITELRRAKTLVNIAAYCLMPNHFHILVREHTRGGISKFMQKLLTGYTMYFNKRNDRNGALFQGKFKATHVSNDRYLNYLIAYIHLNPIKLIEPKWKEQGIVDQQRAKRYLEKYKHSSYLNFLDQERLENIIMTRNVLPKYFLSKLDFKQLVTDWLTHKSEQSKVEPWV